VKLSLAALRDSTVALVKCIEKTYLNNMDVVEKVILSDSASSSEIVIRLP